MQPYFFPYLGYFQLLGAVDHFVIHNDVQWIGGGWINRNRICVHGREQMLTVPVASSGSLGLIRDRLLAPDFDRQRPKLLRLVREAYRRAPCFDAVSRLFEECLDRNETHIERLIVRSLRQICNYLSLTTPMTTSSELQLDPHLKGEDRVLAICDRMKARHYINPAGGTELYSRERFEQNGIQLSFLKPQFPEYRQYRSPFLPGLSILDVMMWSTPEAIRASLNCFELS